MELPRKLLLHRALHGLEICLLSLLVKLAVLGSFFQNSPFFAGTCTCFTALFFVSGTSNTGIIRAGPKFKMVFKGGSWFIPEYPDCISPPKGGGNGGAGRGGGSDTPFPPWVIKKDNN